MRAARSTVATAPTPAGSVRLSLGPRSLAVVLFNFSDDHSQPVTAEYGDPFDVMGSRHVQVNGVYKAALGIGDVTTISVDGTYQLAPAEGDSGPRLFRIYRDTSGGEARDLYLEARRSGPADPGAGGDCLTAAWFGNRDLAGEPIATTPVAGIDFLWGQSAPAAGVPADDFSARFSGYLVPAASGTHALHTASDDGVRLLIDGVAVVDDWMFHGTEGNVAPVELEAGRAYRLDLEYFEGSVDATARLAWTSPDRACEPVPTARLFSEAPDGDGDDEPVPVPPGDEVSAGDLVGGCATAGGSPLAGAIAFLLLLAAQRIASVTARSVWPGSAKRTMRPSTLPSWRRKLPVQ